MISCGKCEKYFSSMTLFDAHRIGTFGETIYNASGMHVIGYTPHARRCMSADEMMAAGYQQERKAVRSYENGSSRSEERDVWFDPIARGEARAFWGSR